MKAYVRGRSLRVPLTADVPQTVERLVGLGFTDARAEHVASAALKFSSEETDSLKRQLIPPTVWPGMVFVRRHFIEGREEVWLVFKHEGRAGWSLDSALFA
jgi:hypothetical protein